MSEKKLLINGREVEFTPGQTILEAARAVHIDIPTLCHLKGATPTGACRVCLVEVAGTQTLLTACSTPAVAGMQVQTESPRVIEAR
ncbi:MAG: (2Fe-2S)-binding protein, partial [Desulfatitalea sp.]|nr:(2Fe-2S)-binding protein [Desulfatitalea sp.]